MRVDKDWLGWEEHNGWGGLGQGFVEGINKQRLKEKGGVEKTLLSLECGAKDHQIVSLLFSLECFSMQGKQGTYQTFRFRDLDRS